MASRQPWETCKFSARTGLASFLYRPRAQQAPATATVCQDPMWVSPSGRQALLTCARNGQLSESVLLLGRAGAAQLRQLEPVAQDDLIAFGS